MQRLIFNFHQLKIIEIPMGVRLIERFLSIIWLYSIQDGSSTTLWLRFCFCSPYNRMVLTFKLHQKKKTDKKGGYAAQILDPKNQKSWFRSPNPYMFNTLQKFLKYQSVHKFLCSRQTSSRSLKIFVGPNRLHFVFYRRYGTCFKFSKLK